MLFLNSFVPTVYAWDALIEKMKVFNAFPHKALMEFNFILPTHWSKAEITAFEPVKEDIAIFLSQLSSDKKILNNEIVTPSFRLPARPFPANDIAKHPLNNPLFPLGKVENIKVTPTEISLTADFLIRDANEKIQPRYYRDTYVFQKTAAKWVFVGHGGTQPIGDVRCETLQNGSLERCKNTQNN